MTEQTGSSPLVSVITACLNAAQFVEQTMLSVLSQTYPGMEYLIIDGGSTDGTVDLIRQYESRLAYWHSQPDRGLAHAFNVGLARAKGAWILILAADDYFLDPRVVEKMAPYLAAYPEADVIFGETIIMTREEDPRPAPLARIWGRAWRWREFRWGSQVPHPSAFTNRRYFERWGGFDETFRLAMDYEIYLRAGKNLKAHFIPLPVSGMRKGGLSGSNLIQAYDESRRAQLKNHAQAGWLCRLNYYWWIGRYYLGRLAHLLLDPFAHKISCRRRYSGRALERSR